MKKKIFTVFALLGIVVLYGCAGTVSKNGNEIKTPVPIVEYHNEYTSNSGFVSDIGHVCDVRHFTYREHSYIQFDISATGGGRSGIVHNPDCKCNQ